MTGSLPRTEFDRSRDNPLVLVELQRKELSGSTGGEQGCGTMIDKIVDVFAIRTGRKHAIIGEMRDRKGQQSRPDSRFQTLSGKRHEASS